MQREKDVTGISILEINPTKFASNCIEAHAKIKPDLATYLKDTVTNNRGAIYAAFNSSGELVGRIAVEKHIGYLSRGKPCVTFGWLEGDSPEVVKMLLDQIFQWVIHEESNAQNTDQRIKLIRGPISFPKNLGGFGCQIEGFNLPRMHCVSTNRPELAGWIQSAGFKPDTNYACVDVSNAPRWESAQLPQGYSIVYWTQAEWYAHENEALRAFQEAFTEILPDSSGPSRYREVIDTMSYHPESKYMNPVAVGPNDEIVGLIVCTPNLYEAWDGHPITGVNVDTIFISPKHRGIGLFSALNNVGRYNTLKYLNWKHVEGTTIWLANEQAIRSIFPHGFICRRHVVFQKRVKKSD